MSGVVGDADTGAPLSGVAIMAFVGTDVRNVVTNSAGRYEIPDMTHGQLKMSLRLNGYSPHDFEFPLLEDRVVNTTMQRICERPGRVETLSAAVSGSTVTFSWTSARDAVEYRLEAGTQMTQSNLLVVRTASLSYEWTGVAPGTYYARVWARNASCGTGAQSNELTINVP